MGGSSILRTGGLFCCLGLLLSAGDFSLGTVDWRGSSPQLSVSRIQDRLLRLEWEGGDRQQFIWSTERVPVEGRFIEIDLTWRKESWSFDTLMYPLLRFYDSDSRLIIPPRSRYPEETLLAPMPAHVRINARWRAPEFSSPYPGGRPVRYVNTIEAPPRTACLGLGFAFEGGKGACVIQKLSFSPRKGHDYHHKVDTPKMTHRSPSLNRRQIDEVLRKRPRLHVSLHRDGDRTRMLVNGKPAMPIIFKNGPVQGSETRQLERVATFSGAGFRIFTVNVPLGQSRTRSRGPIWKGDGQYDVTELEDAVYDVLANDPDANVMFEILVNNYYEWGLANPDHMFQDAQGVHSLWASSVREVSPRIPGKGEYLIWMASLQSDRFRREVAAALREVFRRFERTLASKAVVGVYLNGAGDNQWFSTEEKAGMDFSPASVRAFRSYLRMRYGNSLEKLRAAWRDPAATFDQAMPPVFKEFWCESVFFPSERVPDYNRFLAECNYRLISTFAAAVKDVTDDRFLVGAYWPNGGVDGYPFATHRNVERLCNCPCFDFFAVVPQYQEFREPGHPFDVAAYTGSIRLHDKLLIVELDIRNPEVTNWGIWGSRTYALSHDRRTFRETALRLGAWACAMGGGFHAYDLSCGWWDTENAIRTWKDTIDICRQFRSGHDPADRIAVFSEEQAPHYYGLHRFFRLYAYNATLLPHYAMAMSGLGCDFYFSGDILNSDRPDAKVMIFSENGTMSVGDAELIRRRFGNSGRVLVWYGMPGYLPDRRLDAAERITGFKLGRILQDEPLTADPAVQDPLTRNLTGTLFPRPGWGHAIGPVCTIDDPQAKVLARFQPSGLPGMAVKRFRDHTEIHVGQLGALTPQMLRNIAREAGIEPVIETDDVSYQGGGIIAICASTGGIKRVRIPRGAKGLRVLTGQAIHRKTPGCIEVEARAGETIILKEET